MIKSVFRDGMLGIGTPAAGITLSLLSQVEQGLRIVSLLVGIAAGVATIISIFKRIKKGS